MLRYRANKKRVKQNGRLKQYSPITKSSDSDLIVFMFHSNNLDEREVTLISS